MIGKSTAKAAAEAAVDAARVMKSSKHAGTAVAAGGAGLDMMEKGVGWGLRNTKKVSRYSGAILATAALAGVASAHPLKPASEAFQEEMFGDKDAYQKTAQGVFVSNLEGAFRTPSEQRTIDNLDAYPDAPTYEGAPVSDRVNGALIFGLYNRRMGG